MSRLEIRLDHERSWCRPGSTLSGTTHWQLDGEASTLELRLFWYTSGRGDRDVEVVDCQRIDSPGSAGDRAFSFQLPAGPYSFSGRLVSLAWALELVATPGEAVGRVDLLLGPWPVEITLHRE